MGWSHSVEGLTAAGAWAAIEDQQIEWYVEGLELPTLAKSDVYLWVLRLEETLRMIEGHGVPDSSLQVTLCKVEGGTAVYIEASGVDVSFWWSEVPDSELYGPPRQGNTVRVYRPYGGDIPGFNRQGQWLYPNQQH